MAYKEYYTSSNTNSNSDHSKKTRRSPYASHRSCFDPFVPKEELTENQQAILDGTHPGPRKVDVIKTINKLECYGRYDDATMVYDRYGYYFYEIYEGDPTVEKALQILFDLTPDDLK